MGAGGLQRGGAGVAVAARPAHRRGLRARRHDRERQGVGLPGQGQRVVQVRGRRIARVAVTPPWFDARTGGGHHGGPDDRYHTIHRDRGQGDPAGAAGAVRGVPPRPRRGLPRVRGLRLARARPRRPDARRRRRDRAPVPGGPAPPATRVVARPAQADLRDRERVFVALPAFLAPAFLVFLAAAFAGRAAAWSPPLPARARLASSAAMRSPTLAGSSTSGSATISSPAAFFSMIPRSCSRYSSWYLSGSKPAARASIS